MRHVAHAARGGYDGRLMSAPELLRSTFYLDFEHPQVARFVAETTRGASSQAERASRLFMAVRDQILYDPYRVELSPQAMTASATLAQGAAFCVPKAILYAACLRAVGIPTRLGFVDVTNHLATPRLLELLKSEVFAFHGYVQVHLDGRVLKAAPAFHASLCQKFRVAPLQFDGTADAMLQPYDSKGRQFMKYVRDRGVYDDFPFEELVRVWQETYPHLFGIASPTGPEQFSPPDR
jgi:transglutaminase-like putative cysteine protease